MTGFAKIRRRLEAALPDALYDARKGDTDSEMVFLTALSLGLAKDPFQAMSKTIDLITTEHDRAGVSSDLTRLNLAFSDGKTLYALRWAYDPQPPSMYMSQAGDGVILASEPLDYTTGDWMAVDKNSFVEISSNGVAHRPI